MAATTSSESGTFSIRIASTGDVFEVPENKSVLHTLIENGYRIQSSCTSGLCGTCRVRYLEGEVDHKDLILSPAERSEFLTTCVSRAKSAEIVLDLPPLDADQEPLPELPVAVVDQNICVACLTCVRACTYGAARIDSERIGVGGIVGAAVVNDELCTGCGLCAASCPTGAISMTIFADTDLVGQVESLFQPGVLKNALGAMAGQPADVPQVVALCCPHCAPSAAAYMDDATADLPLNLQIVELPCTGRVDNLHLMRTFEAGADGVLVTGCEPGRCYHSTGNLNAARRVERAEGWLEDVGLGGKRVRMVHLPVGGVSNFAEAAEGLARDILSAGPNPLRKTGDGGDTPATDDHTA